MSASQYRRLALVGATVFSLMLHGLVLLAPGWSVPARTPAHTPLQARLIPVQPVPPPPVPSPPAPRKRPKPIEPVRPLPAAPEAVVSEQTPLAASGEPSLEAPIASATTEAESIEPLQTPAPATTESPEPEQPGTVPDLDPGIKAADALGSAGHGETGWPSAGRVLYSVRFGSGGFEAGYNDLSWEFGDGRYRIMARVQTTGLARLVKRYDLEQEATGSWLAGVLRPERFVELQGERRSETTFDHAAGVIRQNRGGKLRERPLAVAADILALLPMLALQPPGAEGTALTVVTGRGIAETRLFDAGDAHVSLPVGEVAARHFHAEGQSGRLRIDVWLARDLQRVPVRIRIEDRQQSYVFDQVAIRVETGAVTLAVPPPDPVVGQP